MVTPYLGLLALIAVERLVELAISRRNAARALARSGIEYGRAHFRWMTVLHTAFLIACAAEVVLLSRPFLPLLGWPLLATVVAAQGLRYWAIASLGDRWNVRVIVVPAEPAMVTGPYRYLRHPNYVAVILEGIALPLVHGAWITAAAFSALNLILLAVRIRCEEQALVRHCDYEPRMGSRPRFVPHLVEQS